MGFFDKAKNFLGGHGVTVDHVTIERQDPNTVNLPIGDTVVKGKFRVKAEKPCTLLSMKSEFIMTVKHPDGREEEVVLGEDVFPEPNTSRSDDMVQYPCDLEGGASIEDFFNILMDSDIPTELGKRNLQVRQVGFFVRTIIDVKGSPFDPEAKNNVHIAE